MDHPAPPEAPPARGFPAWRRAHARPAGARCFNCGAVLQGPWCHACGQLGEDYHRSLAHLAWEAMEAVFHADGRFWHTIPRLIVRPASLTRDYLAGKRASQVPPLRIFLVVLFLLFLSGEILSRGHRHINWNSGQLSPADRAQIGEMRVRLGTGWDDALTAWAREHVGRALANPDAALAAAGVYAHDFAFLSLPVSALLLSVIFFRRRGFVVFDHLIFSMHSLSFLGLLIIAIVPLGASGSGAAPFLLLAAPVHLFLHMRGVYRTGAAGTLLRMAALFLFSAVALSLLLAALLVLGIAAA